MKEFIMNYFGYDKCEVCDKYKVKNQYKVCIDDEIVSACLLYVYEIRQEQDKALDESMERFKESHERYQRSSDKLMFHYELYKIQKQLDEVNLKLDRLEEKQNEREAFYKQNIEIDGKEIANIIHGKYA